MPELAEVEYFRKRWDAGVGQRMSRVAVHGEKRLFRGSDPDALERVLRGSTLLGSESRGKQMAFRFSKNAWIGIHLGMTGKLSIADPGFEPQRHDHLVLFQRTQTLVFTDARMFGRVRFFHGKGEPPWWSEIPPAVTAKEFTVPFLRAILERRKRAPLKAILLAQDIFPGVGNWMADEILWQSRLHPLTTPGDLSARKVHDLWKSARLVCRGAMKTIGVDWGDPPANWLMHQRWKKGGQCPRDRTVLERATIAGRTTAWCAKCQRA